MNSTKRRRSIIQKSDDLEIKKLYLVDSNRKSFTHFEDLSNELIYEIFDFLDILHVHKTFSNLNARFDNLFIHSTLPIKINLSSMSKSTFRDYYQHIITPNKHRIHSLHLSNIFLVDLLFSPPHLIKEFFQLKKLTLDNIKSSYLNNLLTHSATFPNLQSLIINPLDPIQNKDRFYRSIFRLPALKYCKVFFESHFKSNSLSLATNESSPIEYLVIKNDSNLNELGSILSYVPQLRRLSWQTISGFRDEQAELQGLTLKHLTHAYFELKYMKFDQFEPVLTNLFHQVEVLRLTTSFDRAYLDSNRWERLISSHMPYLRIFDFKHTDTSRTGTDLPLTCMSLNNMFSSSFWIEHRWFFTHQCFANGNWNQTALYSTDPYRRKHYTLYGEPSEEGCLHHQETDLTVVRHVRIQGEKAMIGCRNYFPNATELTLLHRFDTSIDHIIDHLNQILALTQLTQLFIDSGGLGFTKVIHLLQFTPNIHTLRVYSTYMSIADYGSIEKSEAFQLVSKKNVIKNFTIESGCQLEEMKLLVQIFPRLEHINIDIHAMDFGLIFELIFSKTNGHLPYLSSLCLRNAYKSTVNRLKILIESNKWLDDYSLEVFCSQLYLWW